MLKIYTMSLSYRRTGCIVVIASSKEAAREMMKGELNYRETAEIEEHEITDGFMYSDLGDM